MARKRLQREFRGAVVRCRVDILAAAGGSSVLTTATPDRVLYPNQGMPVAFESLALVELRTFRTRAAGIQVLLVAPGLQGNVAKREQWSVQPILLTGHPGMLRESLRRLFYLPMEELDPQDVQACLDRHPELAPGTRRAFCGVSPEALPMAFGAMVGDDDE